ncbi:MAG: DsrE family protein [Pseudomonadota bacterium]|nr:MAG: DsrE family protein [Pseudomonadota bacterium]
MKHLVVLNDPPYGTERSYNGLRLARELLKDPARGNAVRVFLVGDAAACAKSGQKVPQGYYHIESFLKMIAHAGGEIGVCATCMDARGITDAELSPGTRRSALAEWAEWTVWADKVIVF